MLIIFIICRELLNLFMNSELIRWTSLCNTFEKELKQGAPNLAPTSVFITASEFEDKRWADLKKRVVEHVSIICLGFFFFFFV